jgi:hypothetical protein
LFSRLFYFGSLDRHFFLLFHSSFLGIAARASGFPLGAAAGGRGPSSSTSSSATAAAADAAGSDATTTAATTTATHSTDPHDPARAIAHRPTSFGSHCRLHGQLAASPTNPTQSATAFATANNTCPVIRNPDNSISLKHHPAHTHLIVVRHFFVVISLAMFSIIFLFPTHFHHRFFIPFFISNFQ